MHRRDICLTWSQMDKSGAEEVIYYNRDSQSGLGIISCAAATEAAVLVTVMTQLEYSPSDVKI